MSTTSAGHDRIGQDKDHNKRIENNQPFDQNDCWDKCSDSTYKSAKLCTQMQEAG